MPRKMPTPFGSKVTEISAGDTHFGLVTDQGRVFTCGSNHRGQLGHYAQGLGEVQGLRSKVISCGSNYTILLTETGELMIAGQLPFKVDNKSYLRQFEQLAKFEKTVLVKQIESTKFTSILAQLPGEERTELFLWGETPLGVF